jgi:hypothetical protein
VYHIGGWSLFHLCLHNAKGGEGGVSPKGLVTGHAVLALYMWQCCLLSLAARRCLLGMLLAREKSASVGGWGCCSICAALRRAQARFALFDITFLCHKFPSPVRYGVLCVDVSLPSLYILSLYATLQALRCPCVRDLNGALPPSAKSCADRLWRRSLARPALA